ncbi:DUF3540 domain-containing protein [Burkholderia pseudomallei]|nr:DUF3540 domain-containing protein [Burkholderia pseudomallei]
MTGRVGDWLLLDDHAGRARRADGCLLAPDIGDSVLIWTSAPAARWPTMTTRRTRRAPMCSPCSRALGAPQAALALPGGVVLETKPTGCASTRRTSRSRRASGSTPARRAST